MATRTLYSAISGRPDIAWASTLCLAWVLLGASAAQAQPALLPFTAKAEIVFKQLSPDFCWFHPRVAALPGHGRAGAPAVIMTIQKHLKADDHYSGLYVLRTDDLGKTWRGPTEIRALGWRKELGNDKVDLSVADVTPMWHVATKKLIAIGIQVRYSDKGIALLDRPRSYDFAYTVFDPATDKWTVWRNIANVPEPEESFTRSRQAACNGWCSLTARSSSRFTSRVQQAMTIRSPSCIAASTASGSAMWRMATCCASTAAGDSWSRRWRCTRRSTT